MPMTLIAPKMRGMDEETTMPKNRHHPSPINVKTADRVLREFNRDALLMDLAYMHERLKVSGPGLRVAVASELTLLALLIVAAAWLAVDVISPLPNHP